MFFIFIFINKNCTRIKIFTTTYTYIVIDSIIRALLNTLNQHNTPILAPYQNNIHHPRLKTSITTLLHKYTHPTYMYKHLLTCSINNLIYVKYTTHSPILKSTPLLPLHSQHGWYSYLQYIPLNYLSITYRSLYKIPHLSKNIITHINKLKYPQPYPHNKIYPHVQTTLPHTHPSNTQQHTL